MLAGIGGSEPVGSGSEAMGRTPASETRLHVTQEEVLLRVQKDSEPGRFWIRSPAGGITAATDFTKTRYVPLAGSAVSLLRFKV